MSRAKAAARARRRSGSTSSRDLPRAGGLTGSRTTYDALIEPILSGARATRVRPSSLSRTPEPERAFGRSTFVPRREGRRWVATGATAAAEARVGVQPRRAGRSSPRCSPTTKRTWIDGEKIPATGGCILVFNHVSHVDPLTAAHIVYDHGRHAALPRQVRPVQEPRPGLLPAIGAGQIPVERLSKNAKGAFDAAVAAVRAGECVVVYPEGTLTRDPDLWPMAGKSGAARIALETGCPVIPVGQWGAHDLLYPYAKKPHLFPRTQITMKVGDPVPLDDLPRPAADRRRWSTRPRGRIMAALTDLVAELRHETAARRAFRPAHGRGAADRQPEEGRAARAKVGSA